MTLGTFQLLQISLGGGELKKKKTQFNLQSGPQLSHLENGPGHFSL